MHFRIQEGTTEGIFYSGVFTKKMDKDVLKFPAQDKCAGIDIEPTKPDLVIPSEDSTCAICDDSDGVNSNAIVFCDGCNLVVHQTKNDISEILACGLTQR